MRTTRRFQVLVALAVSLAVGAAASAQTLVQAKRPNFFIIRGDDIGWFNSSCYHGGIMGYQTPNIDRIAREGIRFTDWESGWRLPGVICWPGIIQPGTVSNEIRAHEDMLSTILAAAGDCRG